MSRHAVQRLPRLALLLFCAAYVLPGLFGRDPWRNADQAAFGYMLAMAEGRTSWWAPLVGGLAPDTAVLPHWLGAASIWLLSPVLGAPLAARVPFGALLAVVLGLLWYATFHLARSPRAQPVAFAFGGEADVVDYARTMADSAVLALIATLGLLQLGHETTPELVQLSAVALVLWGLAAAPYRRKRARAAIMLSLPLLSASGAPAMAVFTGIWATWAMWRARRDTPSSDNFMYWVAAATVGSALVGLLMGTWAWRLLTKSNLEQTSQVLRLLVWFLWPAGLLAAWTWWRWRQHLMQRHMSVPTLVAVVGLVACLAAGGHDRALMLGLPGFAVLAAFALPTLRRGAASAVDWFSVFFFSIAAALIWVIYLSLVTGVPAKPAANVARLAVGFEMRFSALAASVAFAATAAWLALVRWRTGRHQLALWKSLVLPAGGVALSWLLTMTLLLPVLDYARSLRPWVARITPHVPAGSCVWVPGYSRAAAAALEQYGRWRVDARSTDPACNVMLQQVRRDQPPTADPAWTVVARVRRPTDRDEATVVLHRAPR